MSETMIVKITRNEDKSALKVEIKIFDSEGPLYTEVIETGTVVLKDTVERATEVLLPEIEFEKEIVNPRCISIFKDRVVIKY